jgi:hypothetical protein
MKLAVGDDGFVERIKKGVGRFISKMNVKEEPATYGQVDRDSENSLRWKIFDNSELQ